jgi:hypothetical protein
MYYTDINGKQLITDMVTQKFMGKGQLIDRLAAQVGDRDIAIKLLQDRGHLKADGKTLTPEGEKRNAMTAQERAIDRATTKSGKPKGAYTYNPKTNTATLKKR